VVLTLQSFVKELLRFETLKFRFFFQSAIRDAIAAEELSQGADDAAMTDDVNGSEYVAEIQRKHFEEGFMHARRSVSLSDLTKYDTFRIKFDPMYKSAQVRCR
jgi:transitional endoplasmic reticulum ATPase